MFTKPLKSGIELRMLEFLDAVHKKTGVDLQRPGQDLKTASQESIELTKKLLREECEELCQALDARDPVAATKELCDLVVVSVGGAGVKYDLPFAPAIQRVHLNNMEKVETGSVREDGKLVKHPNHPKVDLRDLFNNEVGT